MSGAVAIHVKETETKKSTITRKFTNKNGRKWSAAVENNMTGKLPNLVQIEYYIAISTDVIVANL